MLWLLSLAAAMTPAEQLEDVSVFWAAAEQHPAVTLYTPRAELDAAKDALLAQLDTDRDAFTFWGLLAQTVSLIGCGHSGLDPSRALFEDLPDGVYPFPLDLVVVDGTLHLDPRAVPRGGRVVAIEGIAADTLLTKLRGMTSSDALSTPFPDDRIDAYGWLYVTAITGPREAYEVTVERDGVPEDLVVAGPDGGPGPHGAPEAEHPIERVPVDGGFVVRASFDQFKSQGWMRRKITRPVLRAVRDGALGVVVDLRRNGGGGWPAAADFVAHWQTEPWPTYATRLITPELADERGWREHWQRTDEGLVDMTYGPLGTWAPGDPPVDVPLVVLTSGYTFSTAADVAAFVRRDGLDTLVGTPTGGSGRTQTSQASLDGVLPNSGLAYSVALHRTDLADPDGRLGPGDVVQPHVWVAPTLDDLRTGADPVWEAALAVIRDGPPVEP